MADERETVLANPDTRFESRDWNLAAVGGIAIAVLLLLVVVPLVLSGGYPEALQDASRKPTVTPPAPVLQTDSATDLRDFRAEEQARLNSYGWVDRGKGIVHIPIQEAMKALAAKGYPDFPKAAPP